MGTNSRGDVLGEKGEGGGLVFPGQRRKEKGGEKCFALKTKRGGK